MTNLHIYTLCFFLSLSVSSSLTFAKIHIKNLPSYILHIPILVVSETDLADNTVKDLLDFISACFDHKRKDFNYVVHVRIKEFQGSRKSCVVCIQTW